MLVESSTLTVGWIEELAREAAAVGCELLDAPVTGSKTHAASGELSFLVGGSAAALETARPVLSAMSRAIVHLGGPRCPAQAHQQLPGGRSSRLAGRGARAHREDLAAKVVADLDLEGCVRTDMMGWSSGWLTSKGRVISLTTTGV